MSKKPYQRYSKEFKLEAIRLAEQSDKPVTLIARELGLRVNQIYKWKQQLETRGEGAFPGQGQRTGLEADRQLKGSEPFKAIPCPGITPTASATPARGAADAARGRRRGPNTNRFAQTAEAGALNRPSRQLPMRSVYFNADIASSNLSAVRIV